MHSSRWIRLFAPISLLVLLLSSGCGRGDSSAQSGSAQGADAQSAGSQSAGTQSVDAQNGGAPNAGAVNAQAPNVAAETVPPPPDAEGPEIVLAHGAPIDLNEHLVAGQINIIDFYSQFCGPCIQIAPYLRRLDQERDDLTVIKVDINRPGVTGIDWGSPVARQFKLHSVPHFRVYDAQGRLLADGRPAYQMVIDYLQGKS